MSVLLQQRDIRFQRLLSARHREKFQPRQNFPQKRVVLRRAGNQRAHGIDFPVTALCDFIRRNGERSGLFPRLIKQASA